jgi:valyl-tRNA synthetase
MAKPKKKNYDFKEAEPRILKFWENNQTFKFDTTSEKPIFSFDTPPPTVSGALHMGHAFGDSQQDFIARFKRMQGFNVLNPFGTDDNGLPTLRLVEKEKGIKAKDFTRKEFIEICLKAIKEEYVPKFLSDAKRLNRTSRTRRRRTRNPIQRHNIQTRRPRPDNLNNKTRTPTSLRLHLRKPKR